MWKPTREEILVSEKFASIMVLLANLNDKIADLTDETRQMSAEIKKLQPKQSFTTKPLLDKEDYD